MNLKKSVAKTLSFFDCFDHPLTINELHQWLWGQNIEYGEFKDKEEDIKQDFEFKDSYFYLQNKEDVVEIRQKRVKLAKEKLDIAKKAASKLRWVPFIKAVFVCNTLALGSVDKDSDIDFFLVAQKDRVWLVRFFANIILKFFGLRVNGDKEADRVCLSFFASTSELDLSKVAIDKPDVYLIYWINQLLPLYDPGDYYQEIQKENRWIKDYIPNSKTKKNTTEKFRVNDSKYSRLWRKIVEKVWSGNYGDQIDNQTRKIQEMKLKGFFGNDYRSDGENIIIKKNIIKLHKNDRRKEYKNKWQQKYKEFLDD